ncbi:hypothetical protein GPJ56_010104 [Histomonas meleagridis]|uniref:uncharacterized protein n=1 Tax=Histomonas meleagridis TaxID=135588 RepID=UPI0035598307|nr:hypothetical protein GPJ56_010104 [Histomonas meleagridis]KAH0806760.1 hypothetical protein GO595_000403 [Histomonas meleagridis]
MRATGTTEYQSQFSWKNKPSVNEPNEYEEVVSNLIKNKTIHQNENELHEAHNRNTTRTSQRTSNNPLKQSSNGKKTNFNIEKSFKKGDDSSQKEESSDEFYPVETEYQSQYKYKGRPIESECMDEFEQIVSSKINEDLHENEKPKMQNDLHEVPDENEILQTNWNSPKNVNLQRKPLNQDNENVDDLTKRKKVNRNNDEIPVKNRFHQKGETKIDSKQSPPPQPNNKNIKKRPIQPPASSPKRINKKYEFISDSGNNKLRPKFFRDPEHATQQERKHLYGPFYVSFPKNRALPKQYAELAEVYGKRF